MCCYRPSFIMYVWLLETLVDFTDLSFARLAWICYQWLSNMCSGMLSRFYFLNCFPEVS
jgi:hypothetical protein